MKKKKKTNHRGGRNKAKEDEDGAQVQKSRGPTVMDLALKAADKDPEVAQLRKRVQTTEHNIETLNGNPVAWKAEIEACMEQADKLVEARKVPAPKSRAGSDKLGQSLRELEEMGREADPAMVEDTRAQLQAAKASENYQAVKLKLFALKARAEDALQKMRSKNASAAPTNGGGKGAAGAAAPAGELSEHREGNYWKKLAELHGKSVEELGGGKLTMRGLELSPEVMRYLFCPPHNFAGRFQRDLSVIVEAVRGKGAGKGGKGGKGEVPKDLQLVGMDPAEVDKCADALKKLDFSGSRTKELSSLGGFATFAKIKELEQECNVIIYKQKNSVSIFGKKADVDKCFEKGEAAKAEDQWLTAQVTINAELVKAARRLVDTLRQTTSLQIRVAYPPQESPDGPTKVVLSGKSQTELDSAKKQVQEFNEKNIAVLLKGNHKMVQDSGVSGVARRWREICDSSAFQVVRRQEGVLLVGDAVEINKVKAELVGLLAKASIEPVLHPIVFEQQRVFTRENLAYVCRESGADVRMQRGGKGAGKDAAEPSLVLIGSEEQVASAKKLIDEVIAREGSVETVPLVEDTIRALLVGQGAKIRELESKHEVSLSLDKGKKECKVVGSSKGVAGAKGALAALAARLEKEAAEAVTKEMTVDPDHVRRIIGAKGATLRNIRDTCNVQVTIAEDSTSLEIRGGEEDVAKAEAMIKEITDALVNGPPQAAPAAQSAPAKGQGRPAKKKAAEFKEGADDFPALGGASPAPKSGKKWGKGEDKADKDEEE